MGDLHLTDGSPVLLPDNCTTRLLFLGGRGKEVSGRVGGAYLNSDVGTPGIIFYLERPHQP